MVLTAAQTTDFFENGCQMVKWNDFKAAATHLVPYDPVAKRRLSGSQRGAGMISSALDIAGDDQTPPIGPSATDSLERRGTMTCVPARERVPLPDANHTDQKQANQG
jgi:hypothetical protein